MTKKKEPYELKKRGRKEEVYDNADLRSHLAGVRNLNQLTSPARNIIRAKIDEIIAGDNKRKTFSSKNILFLVTVMGEISKKKVKYFIDGNPQFSEKNYGNSSVRDYKRVVTEVAIALSKLLAQGTPLRVDAPKGDEYLTGHEAFELINMVHSGKPKNELLELIKKIYPDLN